MQWSQDDFLKIQKLLLSEDESNQLIGLELLKQNSSFDEFASLLVFLSYADINRVEVVKNIKELLVLLDSTTFSYWENACRILYTKKGIEAFEKHIDLFDSYVKTSARFAKTYMRIAKVMQHFGDDEIDNNSKNLEYLQKAADFHPTDYDANYDYAFFLDNTPENADTIIKHYLRCLDIDNSYYGLYHNLGKAYSAKEDYAKAIEVLREGLMKHPDKADGMIELSLAVKEKGEIEEARKLLELALEIDAYSHLAHNNLAFLLWDSFQEYDLALKHIQKALEIYPEYALYWHTLAEVEWYGFKNKEKALAALHQGKKHDRNYLGGDDMIKELENL